MRISPGWMGSMRSLSVVVDEFDIVCTSLSPDKADSPLSIHTDAVLSTTVAHQLLAPVAGRDAKILDISRSVDEFELSQRRSMQRAVNTLDVLFLPDSLRVLAGERADHRQSV